MSLQIRRRWTALPLTFICVVGLATAAEEPPVVTTDEVEVTATRQPENPLEIPASVSIVSGDELAARGVTDLPSALAMVAGVVASPGGDGGPAGSVPEMWGLREFDAFLLVVDGVPWGGAFVPALNAVDMHNIERIEVLRGAAPVMYGATSFVGVIHVIHRAAGAEGRVGSLFAGRFGSYGVAYSSALPSSGDYKHSVSADYETRGYIDDRTGFDRAHVAYRGASNLWGGKGRIDVDLLQLKQDPASPHPREGLALTTRTPLDANHNPSDARLDDDRYHIALGYGRAWSKGTWDTTLALTRTTRDTTRGFLAALENEDPNAVGFRQDVTLTDIYFDTHVFVPLAPKWDLVAGFDHLYGKGKQESANFDYFVPLSGRNAPSSSAQPIGERTELEDERNFSGVYAQVEFRPIEAVRIEVGGRLNRTEETLEGEVAEQPTTDKRTFTRGSGVVGVSGRLWNRDKDAVWVFADYRNTFKPAVVDFGPESEGEILEPEEATSWEGGFKGKLAEGRFEFEVTGFQMDFQNVVTSDLVNGLPALVNAGKERFEGAEVELSYRVSSALRVQGSFARHEARFRDFVRLFDGVPTQLRGNRFEMSPRTLAGVGLTYAPAAGVFGYVTWNYTGDRFLNKRNTALTPSFPLWNAGVGYRFGKSEVRLDGSNLSNERDPVTESELGDAQYYRQPARSYSITWTARY